MAHYMSIRFRDHCQLVCMDDKHKCKVGEPGLPVAADERGKQVVVSNSGKILADADHDFTKCSLIPSVILVCDILIALLTCKKSLWCGYNYKLLMTVYECN